VLVTIVPTSGDLGARGEHEVTLVIGGRTMTAVIVVIPRSN
jgi:hypothetical protein